MRISECHDDVASSEIVTGHSQRAYVLLMSGEFASAVVGGAVQRAVKSPVLFFPIHLAVSVSAPPRKGHKTFFHTQQKKHPLAKRCHGADCEIFNLPAVQFAGARPDNFGRLGTMRLNLITVAVRIVDVQAPFTQSTELLPAVLNVVS